jgi:serine/threonine protein kinase
MKNLIPGQIISHYRITEKLGEGGMGMVYQIKDTKLGRKVTPKFLPQHISADSEVKARFEIKQEPPLGYIVNDLAMQHL